MPVKLRRISIAQICGIAAMFALISCDAPEEEASGGMGMPGSRGPVPVVVAPVVEENYTDSFTALGNAEANEAVDIIARAASVVTGIYFEEGQQVTVGTVLVRLDDREFAAQLGVARAELDKVTSQYKRAKSLEKTRVVSVAELDELAADVRRAEADLQAAQTRLDHCTIRAPIAGVVGLRRVSPGDLVGTDTVITTLDDVGTIRLAFAMPETFLANIKEGMAVEASTEVYSGRSFAGKVIGLDSRIDPVTRSITVVAAIANPDNLIRPGMFMTVNLQRERSNVLLIPEEALAPRSGRQFVYVVKDGVVEEREVTLGVRAPGRAEVRAGLEAGEEVIVEGVQKVRPGANVILQAAST
ncbi:MAG: efflux RND transporter periplasmic adaptor subunit [Gammaproteobacteria bacterium]